MNYTKDDLSPIFPASEKPVRVGWYMATCFNDCRYFLNYWWNGDFWTWDKQTSHGPFYFPIKYWYGLKAKP